MKKMKILTTSISILLGTGVLTGCCDATVPEAPLAFESITLGKDKMTLSIDESADLTAIVKANKDTYEDKVQWSSSNETIATVKDGKVTAKAVGTAVITAKIGDVSTICTITVTEDLPIYSFVGLTKKKSYVTSISNKGIQTNKEEEFKDLTRPYMVGTDNEFNILPNLTIINDNLEDFDNEDGSIEKWNQDFKYTVSKIEGSTKSDAPVNEYEITNNRGGKIQFKDAAIGNDYEIKVTAGGLSATVEARQSSSVTYEVSVVKGYNVYNSKELGYADQRHGNGPDVNDWKVGDVAGFCPKWDEFKAANGMKTDYNPDCLIIQDNLKVTKDDVPSTFFYTEEELKDANDPKAVGSMKDSCDLYLYLGLNGNSTSNTDYNRENTLKIYGNYFTVDFSSFPLVKRGWGEKTEEGKVVSHATGFRCFYGSLDFADLKIRGNSKRAITEEDTVNAGGLIMFKCTYNSKNVNTTNVISRQCFITYMGEEPATENPYRLSFEIKNCKSYDSYNCHIYNYCGIVNCENSDFGMCGGPVLIADHGCFSNAEGPEEFDTATLTYKVNGYAPDSTFKDCTFNNFVAGSEAWFTQMGATVLVPKIKQMSDLYAPYGMTYTVDKDGKPMIVSQATGDSISMFNFIALNKVSGESLEAVQSPACGQIKFINSEKNTENIYNYAAPDKAKVDGAKEIMEALMTAQALPDEQKMEYGLTLAALAQKYGVAFTDANDLVANLTAYATTVGAEELTNHALLRGANGATAPVMQNGDALVSYNQRTTDPTNTYFLQDISNVATWTSGTPNITPIDATHPFVTNRPDETAVYYAGMMLIIGLNYLA